MSGKVQLSSPTKNVQLLCPVIGGKVQLSPQQRTCDSFVATRFSASNLLPFLPQSVSSSARASALAPSSLIVAIVVATRLSVSNSLPSLLQQRKCQFTSTNCSSALDAELLGM